MEAAKFIDNEEIPLGLCECGCGQITKICPQTDRKRGYTKGQPNRFIKDHHTTKRFKEKSQTWRGGKYIHPSGYVYVMAQENPRSNIGGYIREHILIAERALGKSLPPQAVVHHINEIKNDNCNSNLVICPSDAYHSLLHTRTKALRESGHASWRKCWICKQWDDPKNLKEQKPRDGGLIGQTAHIQCQRDCDRTRHRKRCRAKRKNQVILEPSLC